MVTMAPSPRSVRSRRVAKIILFLLIIDGMLLAGAELLAGWLGPPYHRAVVQRTGLAQESNSATRRVFLFGESTIDGWPYSSKASIARWLEETLRAVQPGLPVQVVNFGKPGRGSFHLEQAVRDTLHLRPDAVIVCVGHNEFLARTLSLSTRPLHRWSYFHLNLYRLAYDKVCNVRSRMGQDFEAGDAEGFPPGSEIATQVVRHYEENLDLIAHHCRDARIPLLLVFPAANLDWAPTAGSLGDAPPTVAEAMQQYFRTERRTWRTDTLDLDKLRSTSGAAPRYSRIRYWTGRAYRQVQDEAAAHLELCAARDLDGLPLRAQGALLEAMRRVAARHQTPLLELPEVFATAAAGVPDSTWFMDHCHPRPWGQRLLALALAQSLAGQGWLRPETEWRWELLPATEQLAARLEVEPRQWRDPERDSICKQVRLNPELAVDLTHRPALFVSADDAEWQALRAVALWSAGRRDEATANAHRFPPLPAAALAAWPDHAREAWRELQAHRAAVARP